MVESEDCEVMDTAYWYISGPMRGLPDNNHPRFGEVADYLRSNGMEVWSPHEAYDGDTTLELVDYFREDLAHLMVATNIVFLPDWQNSAGARIEYLLAKELGLSMHLVIFAQQDGSDEYVFDVFDLPEWAVPVELQAGTIVRNGARQATYGHPSQDFMRTASMWQGLGIAPAGDAADVALGMVSLKLSRLKGTRGHHDSIVDAIGYLICYSRIVGES